MFTSKRCPLNHAVAWLEGDRSRLRRNLLLGADREFPRTLTTEVKGRNGLAAKQTWVRVRVDEAGEAFYRPLGRP